MTASPDLADDASKDIGAQAIADIRTKGVAQSWTDDSIGQSIGPALSTALDDGFSYIDEV